MADAMIGFLVWPAFDVTGAGSFSFSLRGTFRDG
jgi:hypothetical protein